MQLDGAKFQSIILKFGH